MGIAPRNRPLTWNELLNAHDRAEVAIRMLADRRGLAMTVRRELLRIADTIMSPVLQRAGRRPEHLRPR